MSVLEDCMREVLNESAPRRIAVLDPVKLVIDNYPAGKEEMCELPNHPQKPDWGKRAVPFSRELWIEREDFMPTPAKGYFRLFPGNKVRLRYGFVVECTGCDRDASGNVTAVRCTYDPDTKSGTPGADRVKVKGNIHWVSAKHAYPAEVRLYDRLFKVPHPGRFQKASPPPLAGEGQGEGGVSEGDWLADLNPDSKKVITAQLEPALREAKAEEQFQFERHGYFLADRVDSKAGAPKFNRAMTLRDSWSR
jgi:glutaminyl-tRNA synthetase